MSATRVTEGSTAVISGSITDAAGAAVPAVSIMEAHLTLFDVETYDPSSSPVTGILNGRDHQDVLAESPTRLVLTDGAFSFTLTPADNVIVTPRRQVERHRAELVFIWPTGRIVVAVEIDVLNQASLS